MTPNSPQFVEWFRNAGPYINTHRGQVFVIQIGGEAVIDPELPNLIHDIALLNSLGIKLVLVHGIRPQIERRLAERGHEPCYRNGLRVTDDEALAAVKEAAGSVRLELEALLSMGLANSPMAGASLRVVTANAVTARPLGVRDGIDFGYTGEVRRVDGQALRRQLEHGAVLLVSPLGFSPTGEVFNLRAEAVATAVAAELHAAKLVLLGETRGLIDTEGALIRELTLVDAKAELARRLHESSDPEPEVTRYLESAIHACRNGVRRTHVVDRHIDGALLLELFTRDGVGTMVYADPYDSTRRAAIDDVGGILELVKPLEDDGALVRRSREKLEMEIDRFTIMERDGTIIACAAAYPFPDEDLIELACLAVHENYRNSGRAEALLDAIERDARTAGAARLVVLTTQATHWFQERGFVPVAIDELPVERRAMYNYSRNSKVLVKRLGT